MKILPTYAILAGILAITTGCGTAPNDQGASFTALSYMGFETGTGGEPLVCSLTNPQRLYRTGLDETVTSGGDGAGSSDTGSGATLGCLLLQNNMTTTFVRTVRVDYTYFIPGATEQPPSNSTPLTEVLQPLTSEGTDTTTTATGPDSSLPPGFTSRGSRQSVPIYIVTPELKTWLSLNRDKLPEAPFTMHLTTKVLAVTSAGDQLESNDASVPVEVVSGITIDPAAVETPVSGDSTTTDEDTTTTDDTTTITSTDSDSQLEEAFSTDTSSSGSTGTSDGAVTIIK